MRFLISLILLTNVVVAQSKPSDQTQLSRPPVDHGTMITVPGGTRVPLILRSAISTKNARENDNVYAETNFPIAQNDHIVIPQGTYVQGVIRRVQRAGRLRGKAELVVRFTSMIFPNGYTVLLPAVLDQAPGSESAHMKDNEGTVQGEGNKGHDAATVAGAAATGTVIGASATRGLKGAGIGGLAGTAVGLGAVLLTRGPDVRFDRGTTLELILERDIKIDASRIDGARFRLRDQ